MGVTSSKSKDRLSKQNVELSVDRIRQKLKLDHLSEEELAEHENSLKSLRNDVQTLKKNPRKIKPAQAKKIQDIIRATLEELERKSRSKQPNFEASATTDSNDVPQSNKQTKTLDNSEECEKLIKRLIKHAQNLQTLSNSNRNIDTKPIISIIQSFIRVITNFREQLKLVSSSIHGEESTYNKSDSSLEELKLIQFYLDTISTDLHNKGLEDWYQILKEINNNLTNVEETTVEVTRQKQEKFKFLKNIEEELITYKANTSLDEAKMNHYQIVIKHFHSSINSSDDIDKVDINMQDLLKIKETVIAIDSKNSDYKTQILDDIDKSLTVLKNEKATYSSQKSFHQTRESLNRVVGVTYPTSALDSQIVLNDLNAFSKTQLKSTDNKLVEQENSKKFIAEDGSSAGIIEVSTVDSVTEDIYNFPKISKITRTKSNQSMTNKPKQNLIRSHNNLLPETALTSIQNSSYQSHATYLKQKSQIAEDFANDNVKRSSRSDEESKETQIKKIMTDVIAKNSSDPKPLIENQNAILLGQSLVKSEKLLTEHVDTETPVIDDSGKIFDMQQFFEDFDLKSLETLDKPTQIQKIKSLAENYKVEVDTFLGDINSMEYFVLDEKLMRLVEHLDKMKTKNEPDVHRQKIVVIGFIKQLHQKLDEQAVD